ncbi:MAG: sugar phosphate isomerase/epimerase [Hungatella sp.]|jgi:sugar phosphate isomerase/epimerase|nr:sugar phosphate isomerase/epimerase [Hungatella sp.]MCI9502089.1 sugar phosphate isomerase/epimerase [Hungatella sp.]MCI9635807.1 sugar phosphate isomerase/epimerase [Hungatella sp.]
MVDIGVQTKNVVDDQNPEQGFRILRRAGFSCVDFSLNYYLTNTSLYQHRPNDFFDKSQRELENYFEPHKKGAKEAGIRIHQMHMPYPMYIPNGKKELNEYLWNVVAPKSMGLCAFFQCPYIVVHGFKLTRNLGSEEAEWRNTEKFLHSLAPMAKEMGITICIENLYSSLGGHIMEGPCCDVRKAVERIDRFNEQYGAEVLGFCFDTGHANLVSIDFEDFMTRLGKRLKVFHIHDNDGVGDLHQLPFTFTKTRENRPSTDWDGFVKGLRQIHFDGVLSFETAPVLTTFPEEMKAEVLSFIARIGKYFGDQIKVSL